MSGVSGWGQVLTLDILEWRKKDMLPFCLDGKGQGRALGSSDEEKYLSRRYQICAWIQLSAKRLQAVTGSLEVEGGF